MLIDLRQSDTPAEFWTNVCIVGSGAAGITLAQKLSSTGADILLLEGGGLEICDLSQELFLGESIGRPFAVDEGRYRVMGGTTSRWRGRCASLDAIDFEQRPWIADSGWPILSSELSAYYPEAERYCGFSEAWKPAVDIYRSRVGNMFPDEGSPVHPFVWRFAPTGRAVYQNWATRFGSSLKQSGNVRVLLHANATGLCSSPSDDHVEAVEVRTIEGRLARVNARHVVLACGGVENPRLALNFAERAPALFGEVHRTLGCYFMQHPKAITANIVPDDGMEIRIQRMLNLFLRPTGTQYEVGFALSETTQRKLELVNCSGHFRYEPGARTGWGHAKSLFSRDRSDMKAYTHIKGIFEDPRRMIRNGWRRAIGLSSLFPSPVATLVTELEQVPDRDSRISLVSDRDSLGLRRGCADWRISEIEHRTAFQFTKFIDLTFRRFGWGKLEIDRDLTIKGTIRDEALHESYHHIGATRMSATGSTGVVDQNCRVHGTDNLFFAGASVMPTGGHVNPTFTIVALALRLADHLRFVGL